MGQRCKSQKELRVLVAFGNGEEDYEIKEELKIEETSIELQMVEVGDVAELSLNSVVGITSPGTIKLKGKSNRRLSFSLTTVRHITSLPNTWSIVYSFP